MREIKFRGYSPTLKRFIYGFLTKSLIDNTYRILVTDTSDKKAIGLEYEVFEDSIGEYTGLKDSNDNEIYENDEIKVISKNKFSLGEINFYRVIKGQSCWHVEGTLMNLAEMLNYGEVTVLERKYIN